MKVILGITGSIAAYKALELVRLLRKNQHEVRVVLTKSALNFITPLCCQTLSDNEVYVEQFVLTKGMKHLSMAEWGDMLVIAPATANILAKAAHGLGDDLLSTTILSFQKTILFVPAMDEGMWHNSVVANNVKILEKTGCQVMEPSSGLLASGRVGKGRFPLTERIYKRILVAAQKSKNLNGQRFLITGGRTEEDIDTVRVVTNKSSGKMALELYDAATCRGGEAKLIMGCPGISVRDGTDVLGARTSTEMLYMLKKYVMWCDCLIMAAAVGDYRPKVRTKTKIHASSFNLQLVKNRDLLKELAKVKKGRIFIGFSLEDKNELPRAQQKLLGKGLDYIVLNSTSAIGNDKTVAKILTKDGKIINCGSLSKWEMANRILDLCAGKGKP